MKTVIESFTSAFGDLLKPRILGAVIGLPLASLIFWASLLFWLWAPMATSLEGFFIGTWAFEKIGEWQPLYVGPLASAFATLLLLLSVLPLIYLTTLILISVVIAPLTQSYLLSGDFKALARKPGGSLMGSVWNTLKAGTVYAFLFIATLPLLLVPGAQILVPAALTAWVSRQVLSYDLLQGIASDEERRIILARRGRELWTLGFLIGLTVLLPGFAFFLPVIATLAYGRFCFQALRDLRGTEA